MTTTGSRITPSRWGWEGGRCFEGLLGAGASVPQSP